MEFEPEDWLERPGHPTLLIMNLADFAIESAFDVGRVFEELESIGEDYPEFIPVFRVGNGTA